MADITAARFGGTATGVPGKSKSPEAMLPGFLIPGLRQFRNFRI
jgi:hypothetical protein